MKLIRAAGHQLAKDHDLTRVLGYAVGTTTTERMNHLLNELYQHPGRKLFLLVESDAILGVIGIEVTQDSAATILHIAVDPPHQGRGLGRYMIEHIVQEEELGELQAETDHDAVGFYRKCGFNVLSLGEKYPGVERFSCRWRHRGQAM